MDREVAKRRAEVMLAFANGCDVQFYNGVTKQWEDIAAECVGFDSQTQYRVKPLPKYRPFKSQEECWKEMHKHPDFGWVTDGYYKSTISVKSDSIVVTISSLEYDFGKAYIHFTFADGTPFGIKEE